MVGPVRGMAVAAVLLDRGMFPQDGTAKLRMALVTGIVDRILHEHGGGLTPVRIMAARAGHLALFDRMG